ncbi:MULTISPECIES: hypothetical protein [unclassified Methanoregula]|uniref:hypothetical protein n=1 Tax=unclassified Methanoregula TaxID=2649730 RepID=UPI0009CA3B67|nr:MULTISPECIES: hypothetical protein [unclassified Methanoregula]OPX63189.1 MAG: hypothetical protein A4E33_01872 [Methanoregula sp. PtaB.Bin085]OPY33489.1 MAG: hypothetical protein A4E34_01812 [Methanoregula sp. PtaU1.Bin006]
MQPIPAPEPYTLPLTIRVPRSSFILFSVIFLLLIALLLFFATGIPLVTMEDWTPVFLIAAGMGLCYLFFVMPAIRLTEDRISYRAWFEWSEMEYTRITSVRYYYLTGGDAAAKFPVLELSGDSGNLITINLGMFVFPATLWIIYDVLKKKAPRAYLRNSQEKFFTDSDTTAWRKDLQPGPYSLPLTLRVNPVFFFTMSVIFLPLIAHFFYLAAFAYSTETMEVRVFFSLIIAGLLLVYLFFIMPAIRLTEDRISCRHHFFWNEMEYSRITAVRYCYHDTQTAWDSGPVIELSGESGERITMKFGMFISPLHLPVIYDVLKKKASRAGLRNSPGVFFAYPDTTAGS